MKQVTPCRAKEQARRTTTYHERLATLPVAALELAMWQASHEAGCQAKESLSWHVSAA